MRRARAVAPWLLLLLLPLLLASAARASLARLEQAVRQRPRSLRLRYLLGRQYAQSGKHRQAAAQFALILEEKGAPVPVVQFHLGLAYARMGDLARAVPLWLQLLEQKPNNTKTMGYLALATYKQGLASPNEELRQRLFRESIDWWNRILRLDPTNLRARYYLGIEYFKTKRYEDAARQWLIFLRMKKNHPKVLGLVAKALMKLGRFDQARRTLVHLDRVGRARDSSKIRAFAARAMEQLEAAEAGGPPPESSELTEDEVDRDAVSQRPPGLRPLPPPGPEPPPPPPLEPRPKPPSYPVDEPMTLQAETLFLDGLDYKEQGNLEKALFAFLQAIDMQPDFSQVYLQIGEVYLGLARLAPTPKEFDQRLRLAAGALEKVKELSPNTLLSHAAHSKLSVVKRSQKLGFQGYHEELAKQAVAENRPSDAFQEYVILLSNADFRPAVFFQLATLVPDLTEGSQQDLRFFLEELKDNHSENPLIGYILARVYLEGYLSAAADPQREPDESLVPLIRSEFEAALTGMPRQSDTRNHFLAHLETPGTMPVDHFLAAKLLAREQEADRALEALTTFLKGANRAHPFFQEATQLKEQITATLRPASSGVAERDIFQEELELLLSTVREVVICFEKNDEGSGLLSPGHLLDQNRFLALKVFVDNNPTHGLGRFLLGWILKRRADQPGGSGDAQKLRRFANEMWEQVHRESLSDPWYHHRMGLQVLDWALVDPELTLEAQHFFRTARQILLSRGLTHSRPHALAALEAADEWLEREHLENAELLVDLSRVYDSGNLQRYVSLFHLEMAKGRFFGALWTLPVWLLDAMGRYWVRQVLLSDLALHLFLTFLFGLLAWSITLVVRYYAEIHHVFTEFWASRGFLLPLSMAISVALVIAFPTGLTLFVPFLAWSSMRLRERMIYLTLLAATVTTPLLLPLSLSSNFGLLAAYEQVSSGSHREVLPYLQRRAREATPGFVDLYLLSLAELRMGHLEESAANLSRLLELAPDHDGVLVNQGVLEARRGQYEKARSLLTRALSAEPRNARALGNLSAVYRIEGDKEKADQYQRWAAEMAASDPEIRQLLEELEEIPEAVTRLPLLDQPLPPESLAPYFRFYGSYNFLALNAPFLAFLAWFLLGGGLVAYLYISRERMDVVLTRCNNCQQVMCSACQTVVATKSYCESCADPDSRPKYMGNEANEELARRNLQRARIVNAALPGMGLAFLGWPIRATFLLLTIFLLLLLRFSRGGFMARAIFSEAALGPIELLLLLGVCCALVLYGLAQYLLWRFRHQVEGK